MLSGSDSIFFDNSIAYGTDILINYGSFSVDGEYFIMNRMAHDYSNFDAYEWHFRTAYLISIGNYYLQPSLMISKYFGEGEKKLYKYIGDDLMYDAGINWYIKKDKIKLSLHYVSQSGSVSKEKGSYFGAAIQVKI